MAHEYETKVKCIEESTDAIKLQPKEGKAFWVPKSAVHDDSEVYKDGDEGTLIVKDWLAEKRGWE